MHTVKTLSVHSLLPSLLPTTGSQKLEDEALFEAVVKRLFGTLGNMQVKISEVDKVAEVFTVKGTEMQTNKHNSLA